MGHPLPPVFLGMRPERLKVEELVREERPTPRHQPAETGQRKAPETGGRVLAGSADSQGIAWGGVHLLERRAERRRVWGKCPLYPHPQLSSRPEAPHARCFFGARISDLILASASAAPLGTARPRWIVNRERRGEGPWASWSRTGCIPWNGTRVGPGRVHALPLGSLDGRGAEPSRQEGVSPASPSGAVLSGAGPPVSPM